MRRLGSLLIFLAALAGPVTAQAQVFRWADDQGRVHYSEGLDSVPERYRAAAMPLLLPATPSAPAPRKPGGPPQGVTQIPFKPGSPILVSAKINGGGPATLMLDTGASRTLVSPLALWRMGISTWFAPRGEIRGATGTTMVDIVRVESVEVGDARVGPMMVIAHDIDFKEVDGLLGRDFLDNFNVNIDTAAGVVTLSPR